MTVSCRLRLLGGGCGAHGGHGGSRRARGRAAPRARDGGQAAGLGSRAAPSRGGLFGGGLGAGLTVGTGAAAGEELDALGDHVDARGVGAVLGLELVEEQAAVDRDLAPGLEVVGAGVRLAVEALDVEVAVLALLAGALDGDPQRADRGPAVGLEQLRVLGEVPGAGPAVHEVLLRPLGAGRVADQAATGATTRTERTRRAAVRPSPSEASGLRSVPRAPTLQTQPATRTTPREATTTRTLRPRHRSRRNRARRPPASPVSDACLIADAPVPSRPRCGLDGEVPGRFGRLHASLPLRRNAGPSWPLTEVRPCRDTGARPRRARRGPPVAGPVARRANAPGQRARTAARASGSTTSGPTRVGATRKSTHQRSLTTTLRTRTTTHSRPTSRASRSAPPDPLLPSFPAFASLLRPSTSALLIASLVPSSWSSCSCPSLPACRRPASGLPPFTPGLPCPVFVCRSRKGGPARSGGPPFLESPGAERNLGRRRGGGPLISKDQHQEINTRKSTPQPGCRCVPCLAAAVDWR